MSELEIVDSFNAIERHLLHEIQAEKSGRGAPDYRTVCQKLKADLQAVYNMLPKDMQQLFLNPQRVSLLQGNLELTKLPGQSSVHDDLLSDRTYTHFSKIKMNNIRICIYGMRACRLCKHTSIHGPPGLLEPVFLLAVPYFIVFQNIWTDRFWGKCPRLVFLIACIIILFGTTSKYKGAHARVTRWPLFFSDIGKQFLTYLQPQ